MARANSAVTKGRRQSARQSLLAAQKACVKLGKREAAKAAAVAITALQKPHKRAANKPKVPVPASKDDDKSTKPATTKGSKPKAKQDTPNINKPVAKSSAATSSTKRKRGGDDVPADRANKRPRQDAVNPYKRTYAPSDRAARAGRRNGSDASASRGGNQTVAVNAAANVLAATAPAPVTAQPALPAPSQAPAKVDRRKDPEVIAKRVAKAKATREAKKQGRPARSHKAKASMAKDAAAAKSMSITSASPASRAVEALTKGDALNSQPEQVAASPAAQNNIERSATKLAETPAKPVKPLRLRFSATPVREESPEAHEIHLDDNGAATEAQAPQQTQSAETGEEEEEEFPPTDEMTGEEQEELGASHGRPAFRSPAASDDSVVPVVRAKRVDTSTSQLYRAVVDVDSSDDDDEL